MTDYYFLGTGDLIMHGDEVQFTGHTGLARSWSPCTKSIGTPVPEPGARIYRRPIIPQTCATLYRAMVALRAGTGDAEALPALPGYVHPPVGYVLRQGDLLTYGTGAGEVYWHRIAETEEAGGEVYEGALFLVPPHHLAEHNDKALNARQLKVPSQRVEPVFHVFDMNAPIPRLNMHHVKPEIVLCGCKKHSYPAGSDPYVAHREWIKAYTSAGIEWPVSALDHVRDLSRREVTVGYQDQSVDGDGL